MQFKVPFSKLESLRAKNVIDAVSDAEKKRVGDVRIYDLMLSKGEPILNGVYLFFSESGKCLYAGKNAAQKFVERIPWHFAVDEGAWMNHYLKRTREHKELETLTEAAYAAKEDQLLLISVEQRDLIKPLEKFFRLFAEPEYNSYSSSYSARHQDVDLNLPLHEVLSQL